MIFVTVGAQLPFDRLVKVVDLWAAKRKHSNVLAQVGETCWKPSYIQSVNFLSPIEFQDRFMAADFVVGHAGMGTIITAMEYGKPLLIMPRLASLGEHRNDHQLSTAGQYVHRQYIDVAFNEEELTVKLDKVNRGLRGEIKQIETVASSELIETIRCFVDNA